jgi:HPt (histidine-containing phosphotransfer) domain-containing protein
MNAASVLDTLDGAMRAQIDQLEQFRAGSRAELIALFRASVERDLARCIAALEQGQAEQLRAAAHSIKGSSAGLGARGLSQLAARIEQHASSGALDGIEALLEEAAAAYARVGSALRAWESASDDVR